MKTTSEVNYEIRKYNKLNDDIENTKYNLSRAIDNIKTTLLLLNDAYEVNGNSPYYIRLKKLLDNLNSINEYLAYTINHNISKKINRLNEELIDIEERMMEEEND